MSLHSGIRSAAQSDVGRRREVNEDRYVCEPENGIFAVIDGMGGYAGGDLAAEEARLALLERLHHRTGSPLVRLREAIVLANNRIFRRAREETEYAEMACVLTAVLLDRHRLYAAHVGDTRLYKVRDGAIRKLTRDHSFVGVQEDAGRLSELAAMRHPRRNEVLRDVGSAPHTPDDEEFIETLNAPFEPDCALLLCSDGLTDLVTESELLESVTEHAGDPAAAVQRLVTLANENGGNDNITVVLVEGPAFGKEAAQVTDGTAPYHKPWGYFWGGMATMLLISLLLFGIRNALREPPPSPLPALDQLRTWTQADVVPPDSSLPSLTAVTNLHDTLDVTASSQGLHLLSPLDSQIVRRMSPSLRGFVLAPDGDMPGTFAVGFLIQGDSTTLLRLIIAPDSGSTSPAMDP